jgi:hypothetical protein
MPGAKIGEIYGELRVKLDKMKNDLNSALKNTASFRQKAGQAFKQFATVMVGAFTVASAAIVKTTRDTVVFAERMRAFAKATNMAVEDVQEFAYAAEQEHASMESFSRGMKNLTIRMDYAGKGMETYTRYFDELGISYKNADGTLRDTKDVFLDLSDAISHGELTTEKQAAALQLLGARAGQELIPMLKKGKQWFKEMADEADKMGYVMKEKDIEAVKSFDDKFLALKSSFNATKRELVLGMLPTLDSLAQKLKDNGEEAQAFRENMRILGEGLGMVAEKLIGWTTKFTSWWGGIWENLGKKTVENRIAQLRREIEETYAAAERGEMTTKEAAKSVNYLKNQIKFLEESLKTEKKEIDKVSGSPKGDYPGGGIAGLTEETSNLNEATEEAVEKMNDLALATSIWQFEQANLQEIKEEMREYINGLKEGKKGHNELGISAEQTTEAVGELFGTYVKEGRDALAILKKIIGQQIRLNVLSKFGLPGQLAAGFMQIFGFQEGGVIPKGMPVLNMAMYNENPKRPETAFRTSSGDTAVIPWDKMAQMVKVETYVTNANPDTQVRTLIRANPDAMNELWRSGIRPAMIRDDQR